jgi:hypothetical protein
MTPTSYWSVNTNIPLKLGETHPELSSSREIFAVFVEADGHHPVSGIEGLFYSITMVYIDVDVKHTIMISSRLLIACLTGDGNIVFTLVIPECLTQYLRAVISYLAPKFVPSD